MNWRSIMFAVGATDGAQSGSVAKAAHLARTCGAELELFQCVYDRAIVRRGRAGMRGVQQEIRRFVEQRHRLLEALAAPLRADGLRVRTAARWDEPARDGIIRQALRHEPDLLVAGSTRRGGVGRVTQTRTDHRLIEASPCPLLLIRSEQQFGRGNVIAAVDPTLAHDKPPDLDPLILGAAATVSKALGAQMHVFHACRPRHTDAPIVELAAREGVPRDRIHLAEADVSDSLPGLVTRLPVDVVVMGAVPRSRPKKAFVGHSAERVLDALDADLLIVKPPAFRCPVAPASVHRMPKGRARRARYVF